MVRHEGDIRTDEVGRGRRTKNSGENPNEVRFRRRVPVKKMNLFYLMNTFIISHNNSFLKKNVPLHRFII